VKARALLERTLVSFQGEPLSFHGDLSPEAAIAVIKEGLSRRSIAGGSWGRVVYGHANANSITVLAGRRNVRSMGTQAFKGRLIGDDTGCVLVGSMRTPAFMRAWLYLWIGLACLAAASTWGLVVWQAIGGGLTLSVIGGALAMTGFPLFGFCLYAGSVAFSASDAVYLKEWLADCISADAPAGRTPHM
jgi:hypothetical protein